MTEDAPLGADADSEADLSLPTKFGASLEEAGTVLLLTWQTPQLLAGDALPQAGSASVSWQAPAEHEPQLAWVYGGATVGRRTLTAAACSTDRFMWVYVAPLSTWHSVQVRTRRHR